MDKRKAERRVGRRAFVFTERRSGFDRRLSNHSAGDRLTLHLSKNEFLLASILILINTLNLADLIFTYLALGAGYREANPFLNYLFFNFGTLVGGYFKLGGGLLVTVAIWVYRRYKRVLEATMLILGIYLLIFLYHLFVTLSHI